MKNAEGERIEDERPTVDVNGAIVQPEAWQQIMTLKASLVRRQKPHEVEVEVANDHNSNKTVIDTDHHNPH